ncbi:MAG: type II secretion system protein GspN [Myxococcales bacterium]|nr:type II secretion system protein GspN [Myxococcota bacterium]MDW8281640.1 type II secretion system protein GspN [Myxococcales bacterium]
MKILAWLPQLSERQRRVLAVVGYPAFGLFVFLVALYVSLPRDRLRERLERELSQEVGPPSRLGTGMDVTIGELGLSLLPPGVRLEEVALRQRSTTPGPDGTARKPRTYFIESLVVRTSLLDLLRGRRSLRVDLKAFGGTLHAQASLAGLKASAQIRAADIALARVPGLAQIVPLPLGGQMGLRLDLEGEVDARQQRLITTTTSGLIEITVESGVIGDGKTKLIVPGDPFLSQGLTFPRLRLGRVAGRVVVGKQRATLDQFRIQSPDGEALLEGYIELRDPFPLSELHLYLRFRPSPELSRREPTLELLVNSMSAGKRPDGFLGFAIQGTVAAPASRPSREPPTGVSVRSASLGRAQAEEPPPVGRSLPSVPPAPLLSPPPSYAAPPPSVPLPAVQSDPNAAALPNYRALHRGVEPRVAPPPAPSIEPTPVARDEVVPPPPPASLNDPNQKDQKDD